MNSLALQTIDNASDTPRLEMGGQAVIEGVLMRSRTGYAVALRREDGAIQVRQVPYVALMKKYTWARIPVLRGAVALFEMMAVGTRALNWSAQVYEERLKKEEAAQRSGTAESSGRSSEAQDQGARGENDLPQSASDAWRQAGFLGMMAISLSLVILMVVIAPNFLAAMVGKIGWVSDWATGRGTLGFTEENHPILFNLVSGLFRALIVVGYVWVISLNRDIRRVFEYHGAEHKAVLDFEQGGDVTVSRAQAHDTLHPRCGTTFIAVVILVSIVAFALVAAILVTYVSGFPDWPFIVRKLVTVACHILVLPLVAGIAFEIMKFCARRPRNPMCRALLWPGYRFQRLTTRHPNDHQVEVAIVSMLAALAIAPDEKQAHEYVVRGLQDDESAPGYRADARPASVRPCQEASQG